SSVQSILEPLAIAANVTQAAHTHLDHIFITLANLFCIYTNGKIDDQSCQGILTSLEKCWVKADQDIFILAVFFNPYIHHEMFSPSVLPERNLLETVKHIFEQVYSRKPDIYLMMAFTDYWRKKGEFAFDKTELEEVTQMFSDSNLPLDLVFLWKWINTQKENKPPMGRNSLTKLAIHILSVIANSAGCEHSFSIFGNIHMKTQNKLDTTMVHKTGIAKMD
ncbi:ribonuclease H-like domain-containing protein, partial [Flammula alnicola]